MPQYDYICSLCGSPAVLNRKESERRDPVSCSKCDALCYLVPSLTAWRPDMTVKV